MKPADRLRQTLGRRARFVWPLLALVLVVLVSWSSCTTYVRPGQWGIKQVVLGPGKGVHPDTYPPGISFLTPGVERMHLFPADLQVLEMSDSEEPSAQLRGLKTLLLRMRAHEAGARVVANGVIRLSVGIEEPEDLVADLEQTLRTLPA